VTLTATLGESSVDAVVVVAEQLVGGLVINEVDYDMPSAISADQHEFVELLNASNQPVSLVGLQLVFVNGANGNEYFLSGSTRLDLSGAGDTLAPGEYLVVASTQVTVPAGVKVIRFTPSGTGSIQNGGSPANPASDALGIWDST